MVCDFYRESSKPRSGCAGRKGIVDVVCGGQCADLAVPATTVKMHYQRAHFRLPPVLEDLAGSAESAACCGLLAGWKFLPPIPDHSYIILRRH